ncbi:hypothetical protein, partial [Candidatus Glomeribacter gigasporarum]|uniref:hypothetical protein n=1 Tax=Candidatus Glomeribacter gigasporarum TaxID=132144 RepID=UPI00193AD397
IQRSAYDAADVVGFKNGGGNHASAFLRAHLKRCHAVHNSSRNSGRISGDKMFSSAKIRLFLF